MSDLSLGNLFGLDGKIALVTGGGTGIGLMIAKGLSENGAHVFIGGRRKQVVETAAAQWGKGVKGSITALELDVTSKESILKAVEVISTAHGKLDILVNNAGQTGPLTPWMKGPLKPGVPQTASADALGKALFAEESFEGWSDVMSINLTSVHFVSSAFLGLLAKGSEADVPWSASIVNITSISGSIKLAQDHFAYNASKAAGDHLTKMLATELALKNVKVRVNAISPGLFPTEMVDKEGGEFGEESSTISGSLLPVPHGRSGRPEEVVGPALLLVSKAGRYIHGQVLVVDGGFESVSPSVR
ncbi:short-chain dehydrogenase [Clavulina sp. PMI_390]|nr:short-chain dehydrogenase [Clavulina sp. PMI_390]